MPARAGRQGFTSSRRAPARTANFGAWRGAHQEFLTVNDDAPTFLLPPIWYGAPPT